MACEVGEARADNAEACAGPMRARHLSRRSISLRLFLTDDVPGTPPSSHAQGSQSQGDQQHGGASAGGGVHLYERVTEPSAAVNVCTASSARAGGDGDCEATPLDAAAMKHAIEVAPLAGTLVIFDTASVREQRRPSECAVMCVFGWLCEGVVAHYHRSGVVNLASTVLLDAASGE